MKSIVILLFSALLVVSTSCKRSQKDSRRSDYSKNKWTDLLDKDLIQCEVFAGIPHKTAD